MKNKIKSKLINSIKLDSIYTILSRNVINNTLIIKTAAKPKVFIAVKNVNWEKTGLVDSWQDLAEFIHWDWEDNFNQYSSDWNTNGKIKFNEELIERVTKAKTELDINLFFSYLSGRWLFKETLITINKLGIKTVNISFDDKHSFWGRYDKGAWWGVGQIAKYFDLNITLQDSKDVWKYKMVKANAIFLPPGGNDKIFYPKTSIKKDILVSFIGQNYGYRKELIDYLKQNKIDIKGFGKGWPSGMISHEEMIEIYSKSMMTLGFGYVSNSKSITGIKGRDFEIPLTNTAYITTYNNELSKCFIEDEEIIFYKNKKDLLNKIKYYTDNPQKLSSIAKRGMEKSLRNHLWSHRWKVIIDIFFIYDLYEIRINK